MKASERAWLKPSATRIRWKASFRRRNRPVRRKTAQASSPDRPRVSGTSVAVLMLLAFVPPFASGYADGDGARAWILTCSRCLAGRAPPSSS